MLQIGRTINIQKALRNSNLPQAMVVANSSYVHTSSQKCFQSIQNDIELRPTPSIAFTSGGVILKKDERNNVVYRTIRLDDTEKVSAILAQSFLKYEPFSGPCSFTYKEIKELFDWKVNHMAKQGLSVIAESMDDKPQLLGAFANSDFGQSDSFPMDDFLSKVEGKWQPLIGMLSELENTMVDLHSIPKSHHGTWLHLGMMRVDPSASGKNIGYNLSQLSLDLGRELGFQGAFAQCTGKISTYLITRKCAIVNVEYFIDYHKWNKSPDCELIRSLPENGHPGMSLAVSIF